MLQESKHGPTRRRNCQSVVAPTPLPDRHDPGRVVYEDIENVLLEAGHRRAVALLRAAGRGPACYYIDGKREREVVTL